MSVSQMPAAYRRRMTPDIFYSVVSEVQALVDELCGKGAGELLGRARQGTKVNGLAGSSSSLGVSGGTSDPVGDAVAAAVDAEISGTGGGDPIRQAAIDLCAHLLLARDELRAAAGAVQRTRQRDQTVSALRGPGPGDGCVVHALYGIWTPARAAGRCRWCADWSKEWTREHNELRDPPEEAIRALEDRRIKREQQGAL